MVPNLTSQSLHTPAEEESKVALDKPTVQTKESVGAQNVGDQLLQDSSAAAETNQAQANPTDTENSSHQSTNFTEATRQQRRGGRARKNAEQLQAMLQTPTNNFGLASLFKNFVLIGEQY